MPKAKATQAPLDIGTMPGKERKAILDQYLADHDMTAVVADGWEDAIVGLVDLHLGEPRVVYDLNAMVDTLMTRDGMTYQDAQEYLSYNVLGAFVMDPMPLYLERVDRL